MRGNACSGCALRQPERNAALRNATRYGMLRMEVTQDIEDKLYRALMAMTEAEAAALDFLQQLNEARKAMRDMLDRGDGQ